MKIEVLDDADEVADEAAAIIATDARIAVAARGRFIMAVSGGQTPWVMLRALADKEAAVGRRARAAGGRARGAGWRSRPQSHASAREPAPARAAAPRADPRHAGRVGGPAGRSASYAATLREVAGSPAVLDLVHLGLGPDGHTASLVPGDPVLDVNDAAVALAGPYQGRRRMTLTYPVLNHARRVLWLVTGSEKVPMLVRLRDGDRSIPAGRVRQDHALVLADRAAAAKLQIRAPLTARVRRGPDLSRRRVQPG